MADVVVEQAIWTRSGGHGRLLARSAGFRDEWLEKAERMAASFGERPPGLACPAAVFARPLGKNHVAIVQVADGPGEEEAPDRPLLFHFLVVPRPAYQNLWGDPFALADRAVPPWEARGQLPSPSWPFEPLPPRTVREVQRVLQRTKAGALVEDQDLPADWNPEDVAGPPEHSLGPALLGGTQVLVDGGRLVFERPGPDPELVRGLWTLLPASTRCHLWPASFAFGNALGFDAVVVPPGAGRGEAFAGYTDEDQACEYPQGRYELNLQIAAEAGNQAELDALFGRRSWAETWRLGLTLLVVVGLLALAMNWLQRPDKPRPTNPPAAIKYGKVTAAAGMISAANPWTAVGILHADRHLRNQSRREAP
jgi:hypothetical protein